MANPVVQNTLGNDPIINVTLTEALVFPVLEIEVLSPSFSSYSITNSHSSDERGSTHHFLDDSGYGNRLTAELLDNSTQPARFDFNDWEWNTDTGAGRGIMSHHTPRQRTLSLRTIQSQPLAATILRPIPVTVPESLPSLYAPSHTGDEEYDDEDDATEADSIFFCNRHQDHQEARIRTSGSVSAADVISPDIGFDASEALADFEDLGIIVAALRITTEENLAPTTQGTDGEVFI